ncbi:DUF3300 domain-containing protein [Achromobacter aloeverae]|uniref:DUF3300 domain-containing protein n=2 Tax=Achromobacter aloeverae TaxID=1750518 RepID=A0A4Q1HG49_9BURK|nr:DUF3300 domain-containing protein [Achromobacter aloeverae]
MAQSSPLFFLGTATAAAAAETDPAGSSTVAAPSGPVTAQGAAPGPAQAQTQTQAREPTQAPAQQEPPPFKPEEIEALVAPIALYPDALLSQVLMASTYPLEIVHAARWAKANPKLKGDAAVKAVEKEPWDISVKSLVAFPQILEPMNDKLDWTQKLGDAVLAQRQDVFAAIQRLRKRAQEAGNLSSNKQQNVIVEPAAKDNTTVVRIVSPDPEVVYVPSYNPTVVYGAWGAPAYPPTYWPPSPAYYPGTALMSGLAWGAGLAAAGALFSDCDWDDDDIDIDYNKVNNIDRNVDRGKIQAQNGRWQHDPGHRQGVAYRDNTTRQKMAGQVPGADKRDAYRGRGADANAAQARAAAGSEGIGRDSAANRAAADRGNANKPPSTTARNDTNNRPGAAGANASTRPSGTARPDPNNRATAGARGHAQGPGNAQSRSAHPGPHPSPRAGGGRDSAFTGVSAGGAAAQRSYDRGRASSQGSSLNRPSAGGGARAGGAGGRR